MARQSRFYLERVTKSGLLTDEGIIESITNASSIRTRKYAWTITDATQGIIEIDGESINFSGGQLAKYDPQAIVEVIDPETSTVRMRPEPNLQVASAVFAFLPKWSVVSHRHIWNKISADDFRERFSALVRSFHRDFFIECELFPITDRRIFARKLAELESITEIKATLSRNNPLFGPLWRDLSRYIRNRRAASMTLTETAAQGDSIESYIPSIAATNIDRQDHLNSETTTNADAPIGDAAILMAADGYGKGEVSGEHNGVSVVVRTSDDGVLLRLSSETDVETLAMETARRVIQLNNENALKHDTE